MYILQIDQLTAGMVLAAEVKSKAGRLLMTRGMELENKHLLILRTWGIQEVAIAPDTEDLLNESIQSVSTVTTEQLETTMLELRPIFSQVDLSHPFFAELLRLAAKKKVLANG